MYWFVCYFPSKTNKIVGLKTNNRKNRLVGLLGGNNRIEMVILKSNNRNNRLFWKK